MKKIILSALIVSGFLVACGGQPGPKGLGAKGQWDLTCHDSTAGLCTAYTGKAVEGLLCKDLGSQGSAVAACPSDNCIGACELKSIPADESTFSMLQVFYAGSGTTTELLKTSCEMNKGTFLACPR